MTPGAAPATEGWEREVTNPSLLLRHVSQSSPVGLSPTCPQSYLLVNAPCTDFLRPPPFPTGPPMPLGIASQVNLLLASLSLGSPG